MKSGDRTSYLFHEFCVICLRLNQLGIVPTLMGSLGLEFVSGQDWMPSDIDIHVPGDPRGWEAPDELRIDDWDRILMTMGELGYELIDLHEHEFCKDDIRVEFGTIDSLDEFAGVAEADLALIRQDGIVFRVPDLQQFLSIYEASSKDSYRNDQNNNKDFAKIAWLKDRL